MVEYYHTNHFCLYRKYRKETLPWREAVVWRRSVKKVFLEISQNSQESPNFASNINKQTQAN